jgi:hypothetical protein
VSPENGESIQILRYEHGQKYEPHWDYFQDKVNQARGGHRYATVLMYLSTVEKGGETVFPNAEVGTMPPVTLDQEGMPGACSTYLLAARRQTGVGMGVSAQGRHFLRVRAKRTGRCGSDLSSCHVPSCLSCRHMPVCFSHASSRT